MGQDKKLNDFGEFGLIDSIRKKIRCDRSVLKGIGDDAAVLKKIRSENLLFTTDMLIEDKHFRREEATAYEIGWKALAVNVSDIAAMGGLPLHAVVALGLPQDLPITFVEELYRGIRDLARMFKINIVGGDTNASEKIVISIALLGYGSKKSLVLRSGAKSGDVIFVTGPLGGSAISKKHLNFTPRITEAQFLVKHFKIHAMIDLSDGLASDIRRLTQESGVGALIAREHIPVSAYANSVEEALTDGEDFELLFTMSPSEAARLSVFPPRSGLASFYPVGKIVSKRCGIKLVDESGNLSMLRASGFDHFK